MALHIGQCTCDGWKAGIKSVEHLVIKAMILGGSYSGPEITHCPWCGAKLQ